MPLNPREWALWWIDDHAFNPIPAELYKKGSRLVGWQKLALSGDRAAVDRYFDGSPMNLGIRTGSPHNLSDVDLDAPEAHWAWIEYALDTGLIIGRESNPASHHWYFPDQPVHSIKYQDPLAATTEKACIVELRGSSGMMSLVPPSIHPSHEPYEFFRNGKPAKVSREVLEKAVRFTFVTALLGRHAPASGARHDFYLGLAGGLARAKWPEADTLSFLRAIFRVVYRDELNDQLLHEAETTVASTYQRYQDGREITGFRHLLDKQLLHERLYREVAGRLGLQLQSAQAARAPRVMPTCQPAGALRTKDIPMPFQLIAGILSSPGLNLLVGAPKTGKSILSTQMAFSLIRGLALMDNYATQKTNVLLLAWDDPQAEASIKKMLIKSRAAAERDADGFSYALPDPLNPLTITDPEFLPWLKNEILQLKIGFCILDTYTALRGIRSQTGDIVKLEARELAQLARLAIETQCSILLLHHGSKSSAHLHWSEQAAGTFAMHAGPSGQLYIERIRELPEGDPHRRVHVESRDLGDKVMIIKFREETMDFDFILDGPVANDFHRLRQLWRQLGSHAFTAKDVSTELGWKHSQVYELANKLTHYGILNKAGTEWTWARKFPELS
jgi:hypothetical protein